MQSIYEVVGGHVGWGLEPIKWLFEGAPGVPQLVLGAGKRAIRWLPGRQEWCPFKAAAAAHAATTVGATQLAYPTWEDADDPCWVVWLGLDIDEQGLGLGAMAERVARALPGWSLRTSMGGQGLHAVARLSKPIPCANSTEAGRAVLTLNLPWRLAVESTGVQVCKSDRRTYWLSGGQNAWIWRDDSRLPVPEVLPLIIATEDQPVVESRGIHPRIVALLRSLGVRLYSPGRVTAYLGDIVPRLRALGYTVETGSRMSGNGEHNSYVSVSASGDTLQVWSFPDSRHLLCYSADWGDTNV
jgi:hypothetical protein